MNIFMKKFTKYHSKYCSKYKYVNMNYRTKDRCDITHTITQLNSIWRFLNIKDHCMAITFFVNLSSSVRPNSSGRAESASITHKHTTLGFNWESLNTFVKAIIKVKQHLYVVLQHEKIKWHVCNSPQKTHLICLWVNS